MSRATEPIVAVEVGTQVVRVLVGQFREDGEAQKLEIIGHASVPSRGVRKAEIVDPDAASEVVQEALTEAENQARVVANQVHLVYSCGEIEAKIQHATVPVMNSAREVTDEEIEDVKKNARAIGIPLEREIVHTVPQHYYVDDQPGIVNPRGMAGSRLAMDMLILHGVSNRMKNTVRVVSATRASVLGAAFGGLCAGFSVLGEEAKRRGSLVIDFGAGTTDFVSYADGVPTFAGSIPVGGDHFTHDLSIGLSLSVEESEALKCRHAGCVVDLAMRDDSVLVEGSGAKPRSVSLNDLHLIGHARMDETLGIIRRRLDQHGLLQRLSAGVYLTGGGSRLRDLEELTNRIFKLPCQQGVPQGVEGVMDEDLPLLATTTGMLINAHREREGAGGRRGIWPFRRRS